MQIRKRNVRRQKSVEFPAIFKNKICKLEKKVRRQKSVGLPAGVKKIFGTSCGYELLVTSWPGHEMLVYRDRSSLCYIKISRVLHTRIRTWIQVQTQLRTGVFPALYLDQVSVPSCIAVDISDGMQWRGTQLSCTCFLCKS